MFNVTEEFNIPITTTVINRDQKKSLTFIKTEQFISIY